MGFRNLTLENLETIKHKATQEGDSEKAVLASTLAQHEKTIPELEARIEDLEDAIDKGESH